MERRVKSSSNTINTKEGSKSKFLNAVTKILTGSVHNSKKSLHNDIHELSLTEEQLGLTKHRIKTVTKIENPEFFGQEVLNKRLNKTEMKFWQRTDKYTMRKAVSLNTR